MNSTLLAAIIGAAAVLLIGYFTLRATSKSQEAQEKAQAAISAQHERDERHRADGEAYERAQRINEQIVHGLEQEVSRHRAELADVRTQLQQEKTRSAELDAKVVVLQLAVSQLSTLLHENNIPIPSWESR